MKACDQAVSLNAKEEEIFDKYIESGEIEVAVEENEEGSPGDFQPNKKLIPEFVLMPTAKDREIAVDKYEF